MKSESGKMTTAIKERTILNSDILIVDDEIANLQLLAQLLDQQGYKVRPLERPKLAID